MTNYNTMTTEAIKQRVRELMKVLDTQSMDDAWDKAYKEYNMLNYILDERYREENQADFDAFYKEHIEGKSWEEIDPDDWGFYSDWHKDMYGFRPRHI
jgi:hypothetical protein